ncbi:hypothetical protein [Acaryochloris marina]|uniref:hypothetical protein n=1 Tax=Acaryochloris marina TaxID=155978 RepID=UPI0021C37A21|nr:hypothetical protein [Acaryochloris marina]BDM83153.1 hypothetical protein AM10699_60140 [Acaryochloris marina MBIC10699]
MKYACELESAQLGRRDAINHLAKTMHQFDIFNINTEANLKDFSSKGYLTLPSRILENQASTYWIDRNVLDVVCQTRLPRQYLINKNLQSGLILLPKKAGWTDHIKYVSYSILSGGEKHEFVTLAGQKIEQYNLSGDTLSYLCPSQDDELYVGCIDIGSLVEKRGKITELNNGVFEEKTDILFGLIIINTLLLYQNRPEQIYVNQMKTKEMSEPNLTGQKPILTWIGKRRGITYKWPNELSNENDRGYWKCGYWHKTNRKKRSIDIPLTLTEPELTDKDSVLKALKEDLELLSTDISIEVLSVKALFDFMRGHDETSTKSNSIQWYWDRLYDIDPLTAFRLYGEIYYAIMPSVFSKMIDTEDRRLYEQTAHGIHHESKLLIYLDLESKYSQEIIHKYYPSLEISLDRYSSAKSKLFHYLLILIRELAYEEVIPTSRPTFVWLLIVISHIHQSLGSQGMSLSPWIDNVCLGKVKSYKKNQSAIETLNCIFPGDGGKAFQNGMHGMVNMFNVVIQEAAIYASQNIRFNKAYWKPFYSQLKHLNRLTKNPEFNPVRFTGELPSEKNHIRRGPKIGSKYRRSK